MPPPTGAEPTVELFGQVFWNVTRVRAREIVESMIARPRDTAWVTCVKDVALMMRCRADAELDRFYRQADVVFVDGRGLCYASRLLRRPLLEMVGGPGLYEELLKASAQKGYRVYYLGAKPEVLAKALAQVSNRYPAVNIVGAHHGYLDANLREQVIRHIQACGAQIVFVGMATPVREAFLSEARTRLGGTVCVSVGGVLDVEAGMTKLAPRFISLLGVEWIYRCWQEPKRLTRRYFSTHPRFILLLASEMFHKPRGASGTSRN